MGCSQSKSSDETVVDDILQQQQAPKQRRDSMKFGLNMEGRVECSEQTKHASFGGVKVRYAYFSQRGYYPDGKFCTTQFCMIYGGDANFFP